MNCSTASAVLLEENTAASVVQISIIGLLSSLTLNRAPQKTIQGFLIYFIGVKQVTGLCVAEKYMHHVELAYVNTSDNVR